MRKREAMDMQLQDKLLEYKREMGMLGAGASSPQELPAKGETEGGEAAIVSTPEGRTQQ